MKTLTAAIVLLVTPVAVAAETRTIKVTAKSEIAVAPDEVVLELAVHTRDGALLNAKRENDKIASAVLALAPRHKVPPADVKTTNLDVSPDYGSSSQRQAKPFAYDFTRSIQIRLTDFKKIEPLLADAFAEGLSHVNSLHFRVGNQQRHQYRARVQAFANAREKAEHLTALAGMVLGSPTRIEEDVEHNLDAGGFGGMFGAATPGNRGERSPIGKSPIVFAAFQQPEEQESKVLLTAPGEIIIHASVTVEFEMLPEETPERGKADKGSRR